MKKVETNPQVALSVLNAMEGQAWYLTPPFVVMALVDDDIPDQTRQKIALKLWENPVPEAFTVRKPEFPDINKKIRVPL